MLGNFFKGELGVSRASTAFLAVLLWALPLAADTVLQVNAEGKPVVIQRAAIVVAQDSSSIEYKHFDLKQRRIVTVHLAQGSLPYTVETSSAQARQQIIAVWKQFGYTVDVTDAGGKMTRVFDAYLDYFPPAGGFFTEPVAAATEIALQLDGGGTDTADFSKIAKIDFNGEQLKVSLRIGRSEQGRILLPTDQPAEAHLMGITSHYHPASKEVYDYSVPLSQLKEINFGP